MDITKFIEFREKITDNCKKVILGKEEIIERLAVCFLCGGHVLLEDVRARARPCCCARLQKPLAGILSGCSSRRILCRRM